MDERYLGAAQAAEELGVSQATLYAYVSRGMVRSEAVEGKRRNRRYRAEDIRRLKERKERRRDPDGVAEGALHWGTPVLESGITLVDEGRLYYRGRDVLDLAGNESIEEVAALIWTGDEAMAPTLFPSGRPGRLRPAPAGRRAHGRQDTPPDGQRALGRGCYEPGRHARAWLE
jgi:citrate synthase